MTPAVVAALDARRELTVGYIAILEDSQERLRGDLERNVNAMAAARAELAEIDAFMEAYR